MSDSSKLQKEQDQYVRITCVDFATRVVGKPEYLETDGKWDKKHEDVVKVAKQIYDFVTGS